MRGFSTGVHQLVPMFQPPNETRLHPEDHRFGPAPWTAACCTCVYNLHCVCLIAGHMQCGTGLNAGTLPGITGILIGIIRPC